MMMELDETRLRSGLRQLLPPLPDDGALDRVMQKGRAGCRRRKMETAAGVAFVVTAVVLMVVGVVRAVSNLPPVPPVVTAVPAPPPVPDAGSWQQLPLSEDGGRVSCLAMDPGDPSILYVGHQEGLFKSNDGAQTWYQLPTIEGRVWAVGVDPAAPSTVYVRTRDSGPLSFDSPHLLRSDDGGATWLELNEGSALGIYGYIPGIGFDTASNPSTVYLYGKPVEDALQGYTLYKSTDRGQTWTTVSSAPERYRVYHDLFHPVLPAAAALSRDAFLGSVGDDGGLLTVTDADSGAVVDVMSSDAVIVDPQHPSILYAGSEDGVYKSIDAGKTWRKASAALANPKIKGIVVDPSNPSTLYAATDGAIVKSADGGVNWRLILGGNASILLAPSNPSRLYASTNAGLFRSDDAGGSWARLKPTGFPLPTPGTPPRLCDLVLVVADKPDTLFAACLTDYHLYRSTDAGNTWTPAVEGLPDPVLVSTVADPQHPSTIYVSISSAINGRATEADITGHVLKSTDAGETWAELAPQEWGANPPNLAIDPRDPATIWAVQPAASESDVSVIKRSTDGGNTWKRVELTGLGTMTVWLLFDPRLPDMLYALSGPSVDDQTIYRSSDGGTTWEDIGEDIRTESGRVMGQPTLLVPDAAPGGGLYAATSRGLFKWVPEGK
jgi:photosystem II stability/assembly factor-like uncharacterized protein